MRSPEPFTTSIAITDPSRRMVNFTSDTSAADTRRGVQFSVSCLTMFCRYPGYGKSIPRMLMFATSAPFPPCAPAPAFGAAVVFVAVGDAVFEPAFFVREVDGVAFGDGSTFFAVDAS